MGWCKLMGNIINSMDNGAKSVKTVITKSV